MNDRMVNTSIHILRLLSGESFSTNRLIQQTSSDKSHVEDVLKALKRAKLIRRNRNPEHKQMLINELDSLGREFSEIISRVGQYKKAYEEFIDSYKKKEEWTDPEKDHVYDVINVCTSNICNVLMRIYISVSDHSINQSAQAILDKIIFDSITKQFSIIQKSGKNENVNMVQYHFTSTILDNLLQYKVGLDLSFNHDIGIETKNLIGSLLSLIIALSNEKNLSDYVKKYYSAIITHDKYDQVDNIMKKYDTIMKNSG